MAVGARGVRMSNEKKSEHDRRDKKSGDKPNAGEQTRKAGVAPVQTEKPANAPKK